MSTASSSLVTAPKVQTTTYEFTKRKRWTDTLFSETSEAIFFIISPSFKILYCSSAVVEILGWKEDQLVDADLGSFIEQEDLENFMWAFTEVLRLGHSLFTYTRFKFEHPPSMTSVPSLLFEVKGRMHYFTGQPHARCVFLSAMPYPNRDITLLNSFLGLKIENESLSRRIRETKLLIETSIHTQEMPTSQSQSSCYTHGDDSPESILKSPSVFFASKSKSGHYTSFIYPESSNSELSNCGADFLGSPRALEDLSFGDIDYDDVQRKKKKTIIGEEQRVCMKCGRTDSPEWRKGPHGPKTLCNACGLRWAKSTRKDEPEIGATLKAASMPSSDNYSSSGIVNNKHMIF